MPKEQLQTLESLSSTVRVQLLKDRNYPINLSVNTIRQAYPNRNEVSFSNQADFTVTLLEANIQKYFDDILQCRIWINDVPSDYISTLVKRLILHEDLDYSSKQIILQGILMDANVMNMSSYAELLKLAIENGLLYELIVLNYLIKRDRDKDLSGDELELFKIIVGSKDVRPAIKQLIIENFPEFKYSTQLMDMFFKSPDLLLGKFGYLWVDKPVFNDLRFINCLLELKSLRINNLLISLFKNHRMQDIKCAEAMSIFKQEQDAIEKKTQQIINEIFFDLKDYPEFRTRQRDLTDIAQLILLGHAELVTRSCSTLKEIENHLKPFSKQLFVDNISIREVLERYLQIAQNSTQSINLILSLKFKISELMFKGMPTIDGNSHILYSSGRSD